MQASTLKSFTAKKFADTGIAEDALSSRIRAVPRGQGGQGRRRRHVAAAAAAPWQRDSVGAPVGGGGSGAVIAGVVDDAVADSDLVLSATASSATGGAWSC